MLEGVDEATEVEATVVAALVAAGVVLAATGVVEAKTGVGVAGQT